ncbi:MAG: DUF2889 domain-containing protein [Thermodesulfobacteriota bacterium]
MSDLKSLIKGNPIHERRLELRSYPLEDGRLLVEGWLRDERLVNIFHWSGQERPPGVVHWMVVRLLIGGWPIAIQDAEAEMPGVPHELCRETLDSVKKVIGLPIVSGYSEEVRRVLGGAAGCNHLTHLITVMGPAALHGLWTWLAREPRALPDDFDKIPGLKYLLNSCRLWDENGYFVRMIKSELAKRRGQAGEAQEN